MNKKKFTIFNKQHIRLNDANKPDMM